jgi:hypothetical protein
VRVSYTVRRLVGRERGGEEFGVALPLAVLAQDDARVARVGHVDRACASRACDGRAAWVSAVLGVCKPCGAGCSAFSEPPRMSAVTAVVPEP